MESSIKEQYAKFNYIKERLQNKDIYPALEWVKENRSLLETRVNIFISYLVFMKY